MQRLFHWLQQLCWRIQLEKLDHQAKIVPHLNRTERKTNEIHFQQLTNELTPEPIDDMIFYLNEFDLKLIFDEKEKKKKKENQ